MMNPNVTHMLNSLMIEFPSVNKIFIAKLVEKHPEYSFVNYYQAVVTFRKKPAGGYDWMQICIFCGGSEGLEWEEHALYSPACQIAWTHSQ